VLLGGLLLFGTIFAINSSLHSYLIVSYAKADGVSLDVGFYYMSNALGRLVGTLLSGWVYQAYGLEACLWVSSAFVLLAALISMGLPRRHQAAPQDS
ncbi:MAG: MFS transporter, partial [Pseudomonas sp.]|nr:MFS transporter [Pseudomonas sp.]